jgi:hypothetical protein
MRRSGGPTHRLTALLGCLILSSCATPLPSAPGFQTLAQTTRFSGATIITTDDDGHVTVVGNGGTVDARGAKSVAVIGNLATVLTDCPPERVVQVGNFNLNVLSA